MHKLKILLSCVLVSAIVAVTYFVFEYTVRNSIDYIWNTVFDSADKRLWIIPLTLGLGLLFYGLQHKLDPSSENHESHGLSSRSIKPTIKNLCIVLVLGFLSLVAGASLGPEAILVPACTIIGMYFGLRLFKKDNLATQALTAAAIMSLMTSFFHSIIIGILSIFLVTIQTKTKVSPRLLLIAVVSSVSAFLVLNIIDPTTRYFAMPDYGWNITTTGILVGALLIVAGYGATFALKYCHMFFVKFRSKVKITQWWQLSIVASLGLAILYLIGGPLVQFTGNASIQPLLSQAESLGLLTVVVIFVVKILAISWSKAMGYRGGLIFPMIFVASSLVAISQLLFSHISFGIGLIAVMAGVIIAERKANILL